ncbi:unnamed protein product, partial [Adineta ricciae]
MEQPVHNARVERITHLLQEYNIDQVIHIKGSENCLPDFLSRYSPDPHDELFEIEYGLASKQGLLAAMTLRSHTNKNRLTSDAQTNDRDNVSESDPDQIVSPSVSPKHFSTNYFDISQLQAEQRNDPAIQTIVHQLSDGVPNLDFVFKDNLLYKMIKPSRHSKRKIAVVYLPLSMEPFLIRACHDDPMIGAHFSFERTYRKIKNLYWWPSMKSAIRRYIQSCLLCKQHNISRLKQPGHLHSLNPPEGPFLMIGIDYCGPLKPTPRENQYVLVITDYFTRHITAVALPNCTTVTTAQALFNDYFCKYGIPTVLLS